MGTTADASIQGETTYVCHGSGCHRRTFASAGAAACHENTYHDGAQTCWPARKCPDDGACHHRCGPTTCFRVLNCAPFTHVYEGDDWPAAVTASFPDREYVW